MSSSLYKTPRSRFCWRNLAEWVETARLLDSRRSSRLRNMQCDFHVRALPLKMIWDEASLETLQNTLDFLTSVSGFRQPPRGRRANAPQTPLISAIKSRIRQIERQQDMDSIPDGHNRLSVLRSRIEGFLPDKFIKGGA